VAVAVVAVVSSLSQELAGDCKGDGWDGFFWQGIHTMIRNAMRRALRIQYASDIHLELSGRISATHLLQPVAPVLVLAGDIGDPTKDIYRDFLRECGRAWEHVVVIAGNHEFYGAAVRRETVESRLAAARAAAAAAGRNVHFLERERVILRGLAFLGCTMWTDITGSEELVATRMNDCRSIGVGPEDLKTWHRRDRAWLEGELAACREEGRGAVVVTHHMPTFDLVSTAWMGHPLNVGFATALDSLIEEPVRAWICGHSHYGRVVYKGVGGSIPCGLNPRGYVREIGTGFCGKLFLEASTEAGGGEDERDPELVAAVAAAASDEEDLEFM
jgi:hypothetical protein